MTNTQRARLELERAGLFSSSSDYHGMLGEATMELLDTFAAQGHSGYSAGAVATLFYRLALGEPLTPITADPAEWQKVEGGSADAPDLWQNLRCSALFSNDGGRTHWHVDEHEKVLESAPAVEVTSE